MKVTRELEAHHITDKNGRRTVVWKKPAVSSTSKLKAVKPIITPQLSDDRIDDEQLISRRLDDFNADRLLERKPSIQTRLIDIAVSSANDKEVSAIASALESGDKALPEMIFHTAVRDSNFKAVMGIIAVYEPDMHTGLSPRARQTTIQIEIEEAHKRFYGHFPDEPWNLVNEKKSIQRSVKQFVQVWQAILKDHEPNEGDEELLDWAKSASSDDHAAILNVLREKPTATVPQIEFILSGGESALSGGML